MRCWFFKKSIYSTVLHVVGLITPHLDPTDPTINSLIFILYTGPPDPPHYLSLMSLSAHEAQVSWELLFDGNDPVVIYHIFVWNNNVNVSYKCVSVNMCVRACMRVSTSTLWA